MAAGFCTYGLGMRNLTASTQTRVKSPQKFYLLILKSTIFGGKQSPEVVALPVALIPDTAAGRLKRALSGCLLISLKSATFSVKSATPRLG